MLVLIITLSLRADFSSASSQPQIVNVSRVPVNPPPNFGVNISCSIVDKYGLINVSLLLAINEGDWSIVRMEIVEGDFFNGTFCAQIPAQSNGTWVRYYIIAVDSIGYVSESLTYNYQVSYDKMPPTILEVCRIKPLGTPILPTEEVEIEALICDDGSGVKNATLFFGVGENPDYIDFVESSMNKTNGGVYDCIFLGVIPHFPNESRIWYFVYATDKANNTARPLERYQYFVTEAQNSWLSISINVLGVDMNNLTSTINVTLVAFLPSKTEPSYFNIWITNEIDGTLADSPLSIKVPYYPQEQRFLYEETINWNVHLIGASNNYPYDSYYLNLTFEVDWSQPSSIRFYGAFFGDYRLRNIWGNSPRDYCFNTTDSYGRPIIVTTIIFERDGPNALPIVLLVLILFFVLGGTLLIEPETKLNERITVFLAILIFVSSFFFTLRSMIPYRYGFTIAEILVLSLVVGSAIFTIGSFLSKAISDQVDSCYVSIISDLIAVLFLLVFLWQFGIFQVPIPAMHIFLIIIGIWYGLIFRTVTIVRKEHQQARYPSYWAIYE